MKYFPLQILLFVWFVLLANLNRGFAQEPLRKKTQLEQDFEQAKELLKSFKNDSANIILVRLIEELEQRNELDSPLGIKVQLHEAESLEKDHQNEIALEKLLHVEEISEEKEQWDVQAHVYLSLARLFEKINRKDYCRANLEKARTIIEKHELDSIYPRFSIRNASYHRIYDDLDSSKFYVEEVLRTAPKFGLPEDEAVGHLLMGMLLSKSDYKKALVHYTKAGEVWLAIEDYTGYSYIQNNLSRLHFYNNKFRLALSYNDSTLVAANKSIAMGHDQNRHSLYSAYKYRGAIYRKLGLQDSAWFYLNKGFEMELEDVYKSNNEKVIEIDARYKNEKREKILTDQALVIKAEKERRIFLLGIISLIVFFASVLVYYYLKLRNANQKTRVQALTIIKNNRDLSVSLKRQIMLQSEVHHRVKNNLQVIISLLELQMEDIEDPIVHKSFKSMSNRIYSMAAIHEILYQQEDSAHVNLFDYAENLCLHFSNFSSEENKPIFNIDIENQFFNLETSMPLGIMLTELLTNSLKYARVKGEKLVINIGLEPLANGYYFKYKDNGPGFPEGSLEEREGGLGTYLLKSMSRQLNGRLESKNDKGAAYKIFFKKKNNPLVGDSKG